MLYTAEQIEYFLTCLGQAPAQVTCGNPPDDRDTIIPQYKTYSVDLSPKCGDFTQSAHSAYFAFSELHVNDYYSWALLSSAFLGPSSQGYGLDRWRTNYGQPRTNK